MRKSNSGLFVICFMLALSFSSNSQELRRPAKGNSLVYFVRTTVLDAYENIHYFHGEKYLGKSNGRNYFAYECEPGEHLFWAARTNKSFITAELEPDATYMVEVNYLPFGRVNLSPVDPTDSDKVVRIEKFTTKRQESELKLCEPSSPEYVERAITKYESKRNKNLAVSAIDPTWSF